MNDDRRGAVNLALDHGGVEISNTIPKAARANPFEPLNGILGSQGERWAALNAKVPHSDAERLIAATEAAIDPYRDRMAASGVTMSFLYIAIANTFLATSRCSDGLMSGCRCIDRSRRRHFSRA